MGTSAGPSLQGIGRGGDSNLVLEMDAHDAKSYPGEPTTNLIPYYSSRNPALVASVFSAEALWTSNANSTDVIAPDGSSTTTKAVTGTTGNSYLYRYMDATFGVTIATSTTYTISVWMKQVSFSSANVALVFQDRGNGSYGGSTKTVTQEWKRVSYTITTGAGATSNTLVGLQSPTNSCTFYFWGWQVEQKGYPTPYVVSQLLDPSAQGPSARPASVNLMVHGNVGTGTSFYDSSPSKIVLTNNNGVSHAGTSEFGGSALKFVRSSTQYITTSSTSDINFGTGDWTIDYWFNMNSGQTDRMHALNVGTGSVSNISFNFNDGNAFWLYWNGGGTPNIIFGSDGDYGDGAWHHMAVTRASGMVRVWVDGVHKGSSNYSSSSSMGQTASLYVGAGASGVLAWDGYLDEVRVCKGTALWVGSGNFTPPTRRNLSAPVVDRSSHDNGGNFATTDMTDVATYRVGEVIRPIGSAVWDFDGTDDKISMASAPSISFGESASFSVELVWSIDNYSAGTQIVFGKRSGGSSNTDYLVFYDSAGNLYWGTGTSADSGAWMSNSAYATNNQIFYGTFTLNSSGATTGIKKMYKDGEFVESANYSAKAAANSYPLEIGMDGSSYPLAGRIYLARIYNIVLTDQQVKQNFNQQRNRFKI